MSNLGGSVFCMPLEGEMLESFAAELGNMLAGNIPTSLAGGDAFKDITPPTVFVSNTNMYGFNLRMSLKGVGTPHIILMIEM
ncbi:hypothetical protein ACFQ9Y_11870 [Peribacillus simplex]|uniref:hypothetical protein n=1 Tax=Peribacillus simplex TaxID=1478 RepID=UPI00366ED02B